jgi:hypothetical protein
MSILEVNTVFTSSFKGRQYCFHLLLQGETILFSPPPSRGDNTVFTSFKGRQYCFHPDHPSRKVPHKTPLIKKV